MFSYFVVSPRFSKVFQGFALRGEGSKDTWGFFGALVEAFIPGPGLPVLSACFMGAS